MLILEMISLSAPLWSWNTNVLSKMHTAKVARSCYVNIAVVELQGKLHFLKYVFLDLVVTKYLNENLIQGPLCETGSSKTKRVCTHLQKK